MLRQAKGAPPQDDRFAGEVRSQVDLTILVPNLQEVPEGSYHLFDENGS